MSKTPEENEADMEAGMTTAERRRRRRRGGGLRVPSDNVPRRSSSPAVVPLPDDPSIAIAYNAANGAEPVSSTTVPALEPVAPEAASTLIDPPTEQPIEEISFESKTREMSAVDLEALGLTDAEAKQELRRVSAEMTLSPSTVVVDEEMLTDPSDASPPPMVSMSPGASSAPPSIVVGPSAGSGGSIPSSSASGASSPAIPVIVPRPAPGGALSSPPVAAAPQAPAAASTSPGPPPPPAQAPSVSSPQLPVSSAASSPQLPVSSAASSAASSPQLPVSSAASSPQLPVSSAASSPQLVLTADVYPSPPVVIDEPSPPPPPPKLAKGRAPTLALSEDDLEEFLEENRMDRPVRVAASEDTGEFEVDVDVDGSGIPVAIPSAPLGSWSDERAAAAPERVTDRVPERAADRGPDRTDLSDRVERIERTERPLTPLGVPVVTAELAARSKTGSVPPPTPPASAHAPHPAAGPASRATPPPAPAKPPPAPPPAPPKKAPDKRVAAVAAAAQPQEQDRKPRSKAWFSEVFDEDYLRTLPFLTPQATQAEAELVAASLGTSPGAKLLDVGCGYGRHAMELAARGYHVVGLDLSTPLLVRGGEEAHRRGLTINFIRGDMRELDFDGQFDGAYCLFSTFGYFDDETNKKTAGNIARALRPGGKCVFEILNRDYVIGDLPTRVWWEGDGCVVLEEVDFNYFSSRICVNRSVVFDDGRQLEQEISIRAYSLHEVGKLMLAAGFRVLEVSGSYQTRGRFFGNQSRHIIVVAERTG